MLLPCYTETAAIPPPATYSSSDELPAATTTASNTSGISSANAPSATGGDKDNTSSTDDGMSMVGEGRNSGLPTLVIFFLVVQVLWLFMYITFSALTPVSLLLLEL